MGSDDGRSARREVGANPGDDFDAAVRIEVRRRLVEYPNSRRAEPECCKRRPSLLPGGQVTNAYVSDGAERNFLQQRLELRASAPNRRVETKVFDHGQVSLKS